MKSLKFGIEIETVAASRETLARAVQTVVGGELENRSREWLVVATDGRHWKVVPDGSLSGGDLASGEVVSPILNYADIEQLQEVIRAIRIAGARTDESTGIHVHIGAERFDAKSVANLAKIVRKQERLIFAALGVSDARLARYCKPVEEAFIQRLEAKQPRNLADVNRAWYGYENMHPDRFDPTRYRSINLNSLWFRGTIEFRLFNGTLHAGEVKAYIQLSLAIAARALSARTASSKQREFDPATARYDFRTWLLQLNLIGDEFKTARHHLLKRLQGSSAWKHGRPSATAVAA
jgi:hypothetical protein